METLLDPNLDGVTHINIYSQGKTELGRMLSNFYKYPIQLKDDGDFQSVEGYWFWLGVADCPQKELLRYLSGFNAKRTGTEFKKKFGTREEPDFEHKIIKAIWYKARRHTELFQTDITTLPFEHYYNFGGKIVDIKDKYLWMINGIDKIRNYILEENQK